MSSPNRSGSIREQLRMISPARVAMSRQLMCWSSVRPARAIREMRVGQPQFLRLFRSSNRRIALPIPRSPRPARCRRRCRNRTIMPRIRSSTDTVRADLHEHLRPAHPPGLLAHRQLVGQLHASLLQPFDRRCRASSAWSSTMAASGHRPACSNSVGAGVEVLDVGPSGGGIDRAERGVAGLACGRSASFLPACAPDVRASAHGAAPAPG